jgi:hypothetical protein
VMLVDENGHAKGLPRNRRGQVMSGRYGLTRHVTDESMEGLSDGLRCSRRYELQGELTNVLYWPEGRCLELRDGEGTRTFSGPRGVA